MDKLMTAVFLLHKSVLVDMGWGLLVFYTQVHSNEYF